MRTNSFAVKFHSWRIENQYSQDDVANLINFSTRAVQTWERGERLPSADSLCAIADLMDVSVDWLLGRTSTKNTS